MSKRSFSSKSCFKTCVPTAPEAPVNNTFFSFYFIAKCYSFQAKKTVKHKQILYIKLCKKLIIHLLENKLYIPQ